MVALWVERALLLRPSLAPTFFQPLLCALMALCMDPGGEVKAHSWVGGVVGGVMRSTAVGELAALASSGESSVSPESLVAVCDW